jgi:hypothetical protein
MFMPWVIQLIKWGMHKAIQDKAGTELHGANSNTVFRGKGVVSGYDYCNTVSIWLAFYGKVLCDVECVHEASVIFVSEFNVVLKLIYPNSILLIFSIPFYIHI